MISGNFLHRVIKKKRGFGEKRMCSRVLGSLAFVSLIFQALGSDSSPSIAMFCGKNSMHKEISTGQWIPDASGNANCTQDKAEILLYCKKMYPSLNISNIVSENAKVTIGPWCSLNRKVGKCRGHKHSVVPIKCLVGDYESPALKVASSCKFSHKHDSNLCKEHDYWADQALNACSEQGLRLENDYSMLQACDEPDMWHGVEFVCCPTAPVAAEKVVKKYEQDPLRDILPILKGAGPVLIDQQQHSASPSCSLPMLVGKCKAAFPRWYYSSSTSTCQQFVYGGCGGNGNNFETKEECMESCQVKTSSVKRASIPIPVVEISRDVDTCSLPKITGMCRALFHKWFYNSDVGKCELFVYGGCGGNENNFESEEECQERCVTELPTTTTTEEPSSSEPLTTTTVSEIVAEIDPDDEHAEYLRARMDEDAWYSNQVSQVIADWGVQNADILKNWEDEEEQKSHKNKLQNDFNTQIAQLKQTHDVNLERITSKHEARMDAILVGGRNKALVAVKEELGKDEPDPDIVLESLEVYLTQEKRGQDHTLEHFDLAFESGEVGEVEGEELREEMQGRLDDIQTRAVEVVELVNQHPQMDMVKETIDEMLGTILPAQILGIPRDGEDGDDVIDNGGLPASQPEDSVEKEKEESVREELDRSFSALPMEAGQPLMAKASAWNGMEDYDSSEEGTLLRWVSIMCGCVALVVILAALARYYQTRKIYSHSQFTKIQVDDHLTTEEKQLLQMQQNGYENPTYKFFEKQQNPTA